MRKFLTLSVIVLSSLLSYATAQTITGTVLNATDGEPIIGASVVVEGSTTGTITDTDGKFTLSVEEGKKVTVSFLGMAPQTVSASNGMVVRLSEDAKALDEVMVVAYGTATKKSYTGSASVVKTEDITQRQTSNITGALAGQVAGVQGLTTSGQPGTVSNIRIRGIGSQNASNNPLYVIDGIPANGEAVSTLSNSDIESVTVLKDAAANALYGARGANGVILITTRRGNSKEAKISIDAKWGTNQRGVPSYDVLTDPGTYYEKVYTSLYNSYLAQGATATKADQTANARMFNDKQGGTGYQVFTVPVGERVINSDGKLNPHASLGYVTPSGYTLYPDDWYKEIFKTKNLRQEYNLNISGSTEKLNYFSSASYLDDSGIIENSGFKRVTTRLNVDYQAKKWLKVGTSLNYTHADMKYPAESEYSASSSANIFYLTTLIAPIYPLYIRDAEGNIMKDANGYTLYDYGDGKIIKQVNRKFMAQSNPAANNMLNKEVYKKDHFNGKWFLEISPYKGLKFTANTGLIYQGSRYQMLQNPYYGQFASSGGYASVEATRIMTIDQQYLATYNNKFADLHQVDLLLGYENYQYTSSALSGNKNFLYHPQVAEVSNAILDPSTSSATVYYRTQSILAQAKYAFADKYFLSGSYSRMASSRFAEGHRWGDFWSVGLAWDAKGESFLQDISQISLLKLKASYGAQGNDALLTYDGATNYYVATDQYSVVDNNGSVATVLTYKGNPEITWETSYNFNAGVDFGLFEDRLTGTIEGWRRRTVDQLYYKPVNLAGGNAFLPVNIGTVSNAGIDIELKGVPYKNQNIHWDIFVNLTHYKNKILKLDKESLTDGGIVDGNYVYREGKSMYNMRIKQFAGVDEKTGASLWYKDETDANGNVTKTTTTAWGQATYYERDDILPKVYGGFGTNLEAYGVDLGITFNYQLGGHMYDGFYASLMHGGYSSSMGQNWHKDILNAWTPENTNSNIPALNARDQYVNGRSDRFIISSNYLSLQNISLGYTLPKKWLEKIHIEKVRVYAVADNVALLTKRQGIDPRQSFSATQAANYSALRTISGGINIVF